MSQQGGGDQIRINVRRFQPKKRWNCYDKRCSSKRYGKRLGLLVNWDGVGDYGTSSIQMFVEDYHS